MAWPPPAKARGMDFFAWDLNNPSPTLAHTAPSYAELGEVDLNGHRTTNPCSTTRLPLTSSGKIESLLIGYPDLVDGIAVGLRTHGPAGLHDDRRRLRLYVLLPVLPGEGARPRHLRPARTGRLPRTHPAPLRATSDQVPDGYFTTFGASC